MDSLQFIISGALTLIIYAMVLFAVYKVFQMSKDITEIKGLLSDIKRNTTVIAPVPSYAHSPESLVRAVHAASYSDLDAQTLSEPLEISANRNLPSK